MTKWANSKYLTGFPALGLLLISAAYAPGVFRESFWSDDYPALVDTRGIVDHLIRDARPTSAGLISLSFTLLRSPQNAWVLRFLALLGLLLAYLAISKTISGSKNSGIANLSIAVAFCIPTFQTYVHWSIAWFYSWTLLCGVLAFRFWRSHEMLHKAFGIFLLVLALTSYPPAAFFFIAIIGAKGVINHSRSREILAELVQGLKLLVISSVPAALVVFISMVFSHASASKRVSLITVSDIPRKVVWLVSRPIVVGLRPFLVDSPAPTIALLTSLPILLILFIGLKRQSRQLDESFLRRAPIIALSLILSLLPIAVVTDNQIEFRILPGYCWGVLSIAVFLLLLEIKIFAERTKLSENSRKYVQLFVPAILIVVATFTTNLHYLQLYGNPYKEKTKFLNDRISLCASAAVFDRVLIIPPEAPFPSRPRLGVFSTVTDLSSGWVPIPNVQILLKQRHFRASVSYLSSRPSKPPIQKGVCSIDLEEYRKLLK